MSVGMNPTDTIVKECQEEAGILPELSVKACSVGTIRQVLHLYLIKSRFDFLGLVQLFL